MRRARTSRFEFDRLDDASRRLVPFRLAPGEFVEVNAAGIGVGANKNDEDWQGTRVGSWVEAKEGDDVTFTPDSVPLERLERNAAARRRARLVARLSSPSA